MVDREDDGFKEIETKSSPAFELPALKNKVDIHGGVEVSFGFIKRLIQWYKGEPKKGNFRAAKYRRNIYTKIFLC